MEKHRAGAGGRRLFTAAFKQEAVQRIARGERTVAELSRELGVNQALLHRWKRRVESDATVAVQADEDVVPASALKAAQQRIKELERALGRKTMEVEILEAARDEVKKNPIGTALSGNDPPSSGGDLPHVEDWPGDAVPHTPRSAGALYVRR